MSDSSRTSRTVWRGGVCLAQVRTVWRGRLCLTPVGQYGEVGCV